MPEACCSRERNRKGPRGTGSVDSTTLSNGSRLFTGGALVYFWPIYLLHSCEI